MEKKIRVLVADASRDQTALLRASLEGAGFSVVAAVNDGDAAYRAVLETEPDVLLTDLLLPKLDGLSMLRRLREAGRMPRTLILSAFWNDRLTHTTTCLGVDDYLIKPCHVETLFQRLRELTEDSDLHSGGISPDVRKALLAFRVPTHLVGYRYLCAGLNSVLADQGNLRGVTKALYRDIGREFQTNQSCVERAMRNAIVTAWNSGSREARRQTFGAAFDGCTKAPSNTRFLSIMAEYITLAAAAGPKR